MINWESKVSDKIPQSVREMIIAKNRNHEWRNDGFCKYCHKTHCTDWKSNDLCYTRIRLGIDEDKSVPSKDYKLSTIVNLQSMVDNHLRNKEYPFIGLMLLNSLTDEITKKPEFKGDAIQVDMSINGVQVDALKFFNRLENSWKSDVEHEAKQIVKRALGNNIGNLIEKLSLIHDEIDNMIREIPGLEWIPKRS